MARHYRSAVTTDTGQLLLGTKEVGDRWIRLVEQEKVKMVWTRIGGGQRDEVNLLD